MVATVIGWRYGVQQTSAFVLGSRGQIGNASLGRGGENVFVNGMTGNLVVTNQDEFLVGLGPDAAINRSYNSQYATDGDNNDGWRIGARRVTASGGVVRRTDWDGSVVTYNTSGSARYYSTEGSGSYDTLDLVDGKWIWTDGDSRITETYESDGSADGFRIKTQSDTDGNKLTFAYLVSGLLSRITTQDGAYTDFAWSGSKLTDLTSTYVDSAGATKTQTRTRYAYDGLDRLVSVTVDLSPGDRMIADGKTYVTTYTYDGTSTRVNSITQTDGSRIDITYETSGAYRVTSVTQSVAQGVSRTTSYTYVSATQTDITDPAGLVTSLTYTLDGLLTRISEPPATAGGSARVTDITYDVNGNVLQVKTSPTTWTNYEYSDANGDGDGDGDGDGSDHNGLWTFKYEYTASGYVTTRRTYTAMNAVLTETRYTGLDADGSTAGAVPTGAMTTRYVYDSENHLVFSLSATGETVRYDYRADGNLVATTTYRATYDISALAWNAVPTYLNMVNWAAALADKSAVDITEYIYKPGTGVLDYTAVYSNVFSTGLADGGSAATRTYYTYDPAGRLLSRRVAGLSGTETFVYDGLGRMVSAVDYDGQTTATSYLDATGTTVVRQANGLNQVSVFNRVGERISYTETDRGENLVQLGGWPQGTPPSGPATIPGWTNPAAFTNETQWATVTGPDGRTFNAIQAGQTVNTQNGGGNYSNAVPIDRTKAYEFVYYFRKADMDRHSIYFGPSAASVDNATSGAENTNPYFVYLNAAQQASIGLDEDRWYKVVGYILPEGSAAVPAYAFGGIYDTTTDQRIGSTNVFRWNASSGASVSTRFFDYYDETNLGFSTYFGQPEIRIVQPDAINDLIPATGTQYRYDNQGRLRLQIDPNGMATHSLYDRLGRKVAEVDGDGSLVEYKYDVNDRVVATVRYATRLTTAQIASLSDAAGNPTGVELDAVRPANVTDDSWSWTVYDNAGRTLQTIDSEGSTTTYAYDGASRLLSETRYGERLTTTQVAGFKTTAPTSVTTPSTGENRLTRFFHDNVGRQIGTLDAEGYLTGITYDSSGRVIGTVAWTNTTASIHRSTGSFSTLRDSITADAANDIRTWSVYDRRGFLRGTVNGEGEVTLYDYNALGAVTQTVRGRKLAVSPTGQPTLADLTSAPIPLNAFGAAGVLETVTYTRNNYGQVLTESRTVAEGVETLTYTYDNMRRVVSIATDVAAGTDRVVQQRYDRRGRLVGQLSAEGAAALAVMTSPTKAEVDQIYRRWGVTFVYDDADRLISRIDPDGSYGAAGAKTLFYYDADGRLIYQVNPAGEVVEYKYDALGRMIETRERNHRLVTTGLTGGKASAIAGLIVNGNSDRRTAVVYNTDDTVRSTTSWVVDSASDALWYNTVVSTNAYNAFGELAMRTDETGSFAAPATTTTLTTLAYDKRGLLKTMIEDAGGVGKLNRTTTIGYDAFGRAISTVDPNNKTRLTAYDQAGRVVEAGDAFGNKTIYGYDARGNTVSITDRNGKTTLFRYSAFNREVVMQSPEGIQTKTTYDDRGLTLTLTVGTQTESFTYDRNGNLVTMIDALGAVTRYEYDFADRLYEITDPTLNKIRYSYDAANRMLTESRDPNGLNLTTTYVYDAFGQATRVTDAAGVRTDYKFDLLGRTTEVNVDPLGLALKTTTVFDRAGNLTRLRETVSSGVERETVFVYDALGRRLSEYNASSGLNIQSDYTYDLNGNVLQRTDKIDATRSAVTRFVYDAENRLILTIDPLGGVTRTVYDAEDRITRSISYIDALTPAELTSLGAAPSDAAVMAFVTPNTAADQSSAFVYDGDGRLSFTLNAMGQLSQNVYDASGDVIRQTLYATAYTASQTPDYATLTAWVATHATGNDRIHRATYDAANRQVFSIDAEGQVTAFFYDDAGRTIRSIRYATRHTDAGDRSLLQMQSWAASNTASGDRKIHIAYDAAGRDTFAVDAEGYVTRTTYNGADEVLTSTRFTPVFTVADGVTALTLTSLVASHEATAVTSTWGYDNAGRLIKTIDALGTETRLELDGLGQVTRVRTAFGTGEEVSTTRVYDLGGRLTSEKRAAGTAAEQDWSWTYDALGRVLTATDGNGRQTVNTYDSMGRLLTVAKPTDTGRPAALTQNVYNVFGNLVQVTDPVESAKGAAGKSGVFVYDALNRLVRQYDPAGLVTSTEYSIGGAVTKITRHITAVSGTVSPGAPPAVTLSTGDATTTFGRDKLDRLVSVTDAENYTESYTLDAFGNRVRTVNKVGGETNYTYDRRGLMLTEVLPVSSVSANGTVLATSITNSFEYDSRGNLTKTIKASNVAADAVTTIYGYDKLDRLISKSGDAVTVTSSVDFSTTTVTPTETISYDKRGNIIETKNAGGARTLFYYDAENRKIAELDALGTLRTWAYDDNDNATSSCVYKTPVTPPTTPGGTAPTVSGDFRETFYAYDHANNLKATTVKNVRAGEYGAGYTISDITTQSVYDANGNIVQTINGRGDSTYAFYDRLGRRVATVDTEGYLTTFVLDAEGNVTREVRYAIRVTGTVTAATDVTTLPPRVANADLGDRITEFTYDRNGQRLTEKRLGVAIYAAPPATDRLITTTATITYAYNGLGAVTRKTEANGDYIDYAYDNLGRTTQALTSSFTDDQNATVRRLTSTAYNGLGAVSRVEDGKQGGAPGDARVTTFTYVKGRLDTATDATGFVRTFGYDAMGRTTKESYVRVRSDGTTVTEGRRYEYDLLGRTSKQSSAAYSSSWTFGDTREDLYNTYGEVSERRLNGVVQETFSYDNAGRLWRSTATDGVARYMLYDKAGRVSLTLAPVGAMANYTELETLVGWLTVSGTAAIGATDLATAALTFTQYDKRGMAITTREPYRELGRDPVSLVMTKAEILNSRTYNAFGEVITETNARGYTTEFTYNTMGRLIERRSPEVSYTNEQGVALNARPTEQYRYDVSGRLIATRSANGYWTSRTLLANTGHGQSEAVALATYNPDGATLLNKVNVFGELTYVGDGLGNYITNVYDKGGRLVERRQAARAAGSAGNPGATAVQLIDFYTYDGLGQRIKHTNNQLGSSYAERTDYDREGRVVSQIDFENMSTVYSYVWDATLATSGLGTFGGWTKTTYHASGKTGVEKVDSFGRLTGKTDLGGRTYVMGFDSAGRQVSQSSSVGQSLLMSYYNTGLLARQSDISGNAETYSTSNAQADYSYDAAGNRVRERYATTEWTYEYDPNGGWDPYGGSYTPPTVVQTTTLRQDGYATYDALGRITEFRDTVISSTDPTLTQYTYDLNGNLRSTFTKYWTYETSLNTIPGLTFWYKYDAMNRFTVAKGALVDGQIKGDQIFYDLAGNRSRIVRGGTVTTNIVEYSYWEYRPGGVLTMPEEPWDEQGPPPPGYVQVFVYERRPSTITEIFAYTADGYLASVSQAADVWNSGTQTVVAGTTRLFSTDVRDAMGRLTSHKEYAQAGEYASGGTTVSNERTVTYSRAGLILTDTTFTYTNYNGGTGSDYFTTATTTYDYRAETYAGSGVWTGAWQGVVTRVRTTTSKDMYPVGGSTTNLPTTQTTYQYVWWDSAQQAKITYDSDTGSGSNPIYTSTFAYDVNGRVSYVNIKDGRPRNVTFVTDVNGQVLTRREADNISAYADPWSRYYYFNGVRVGEITNNAPFEAGSYISAVNNRIMPPTGGSTSTPFYTGNYGSPSADFDQAYEALTPNSIQGSGSSWTVRTGDTLQSIASAVWGDSSLWYLIADANGLTSSSLLSPGQLLTVPAKVGNFHNTSDTFRPYDPNKALGDVNPTQPAPPKKPGGCGTVGTIIAVVIAVALAAVLAPYAIAAVANLGAATGFTAAGVSAAIAGGTTVVAGASTSLGLAAVVAGGAIAGAAGSIASQAFLMATGAQDQFDWKGLAMSAIAGGIGAGVGQIGALQNVTGQVAGNFVKGMARGAISSVLTQGVGVATGLQQKFSWTSVAVSAVAGGVSSGVATAWGVPANFAESMASLAVSSLAGSVTGAAVRTAIDGGNFGDNVLATLPDVIGSTIGQALAGAFMPKATPVDPEEVVAKASVGAVDKDKNIVDPKFATIDVADRRHGKLAASGKLFKASFGGAAASPDNLFAPVRARFSLDDGRSIDMVISAREGGGVRFDFPDQNIGFINADQPDGWADWSYVPAYKSRASMNHFAGDYESTGLALVQPGFEGAGRAKYAQDFNSFLGAEVTSRLAERDASAAARQRQAPPVPVPPPPPSPGEGGGSAGSAADAAAGSRVQAEVTNGVTNRSATSGQGVTQGESALQRAGAAVGAGAGGGGAGSGGPGATPPGGATPAPGAGGPRPGRARDPGQNLMNHVTRGLKDFGTALILGDFAETNSIAGIAGQLVGSLNPLADVRDFGAALYHVAKGKKGAWVDLAAAGIGFIPIAGDGVKQVIKHRDEIKALARAGGAVVDNLGDEVSALRRMGARQRLEASLGRSERAQRVEQLAAANAQRRAAESVPVGGPQLLPTEGNVGTYRDLIRAGTKGDNITPNHIPSANRMAREGVSRGDGIAINMEQPVPGVGGRHRATFTYGTQADIDMSARDALAAGVWDARRIYRDDGLYTPDIRTSLQDLIGMNKSRYPEIFGRPGR